MDLITNRSELGFQKRICKQMKIRWFEMLFPIGVTIFVVRIIAPLVDKSFSSSMNGSDLEQMRDKEWKTSPRRCIHLE